MIRRAFERQKAENTMFGGPGLSHFTRILNEGEFCGKGRLFSHVLLHPGEGIGNHSHNNEFEVYCFIKGNGTYDDNGKNVEVSAGDVTICPSGENHGIFNSGNEDLEFIALILFCGDK